MLSPPFPVPVGSPPCTMKPFMLLSPEYLLSVGRSDGHNILSRRTGGTWCHRTRHTHRAPGSSTSGAHELNAWPTDPCSESHLCGLGRRIAMDFDLQVAHRRMQCHRLDTQQDAQAVSLAAKGTYKQPHVPTIVLLYELINRIQERRHCTQYRTLPIRPSTLVK